MAYKSYLISKYENTHENVFFRELNQLLKKEYSERQGLHILIGNLEVGGHSIDAVFIKDGAIIVVDFKDYSGELTFSENNPWTLKVGKNEIFVSGGSASRNPYQQVKAYRRSLFEFLAERKNEILSPNHEIDKWDHVNCIVLFHNSIKYNINTIPEKINKYFFIEDKNTILNKLNDIYSANLNFNDLEIVKILEVLNIKEENLYDENAPIETENIKVGIDLKRINQLMPENINKLDEVKRALHYYKTMVQIEEIKESEISNQDKFPFEFNYQNDVILDLSKYTNFYKIYENNKKAKFPKNLYVGLNALILTKRVIFCYNIYFDSEINSLNNIQIKFNEFIINSSAFRQLNLSEDIIEEMQTNFKSENSLRKNIEVISEILGLEIIIEQSITFGLSEKTNYTLQLQSELKSLIKKNINNNSFFTNFLLKKDVGRDNIYNNKPLINISKLNQEQYQSINQLFKQKLTVITGPPGTGKTQVVKNIIANAIINNKKVLFTSNNNKAVDNVVDGLSQEIDNKYFLRLGKEEYVQNTIQNLNLIINKKTNNEINDLSDELTKKNYEFEENKKRSLELNELLNSLNLLKEKQSKTRNLLEDKKIEYSNWKESQTKEHFDFFIVNNLEIKIYNADFNNILLEIKEAKNSFFIKIIFNIFNKKNIINEVRKINFSLPEKIRVFVDRESPFVNPNNLLDSLENNLLFIKSLENIKREINLKETEFKEIIQKFEKELSEFESKISYIELNYDNFTNEIVSIEDNLPLIGKDILKIVINEKIRLSQTSDIIRYKEYLENGLPWQDNLRVEVLENTHNFLNSFNLIATTNLSIKKSFILEPQIFDIVVVDEATQSNISSILPILYRAKSIVIIGDPLQLPHITKIDDVEEKYVRDKLELQSGTFNYIKNSLFHLAKDISDLSALKSYFLNEHFRCHPDIIDFSNIYFYQMKAGHELSIKTKRENFIFGKPGIHWIDVKGIVDKNENKNIEEARKSIELAERLSNEFPTASIGIISPFKNQYEYINDKLGKLKEKDVTCGTVYNFQGDEKDIIIFSLIVNQNSKSSLTRFINEHQPYLLNVAITRARSALYIVGDFEYCKNLNRNGSTLLSNLASYVETIQNRNNNVVEEIENPVINNPRIQVIPELDIPQTNTEIMDLINVAIQNNQKLRIDYVNNNNIPSSRVVSNIQINNEFVEKGYMNQHIKAFCHKSDEDRTFNISRIIKAEIVH